MKDRDEKPGAIMEAYFRLEEGGRLIVLGAVIFGASVTLACILDLLFSFTPPWWAG